MTKTTAEAPVSRSSNEISELLEQYGCGPIRFSGAENGLLERHLYFDKAIDSASASARDRFEAVARSVRDVLSHRWVLTEKTYEARNAKRLYYLSMEFLIRRSLANQRLQSSSGSGPTTNNPA
jgi:glycogen phosphorylase